MKQEQSFRDIIPTERRSIRDIPIAKNHASFNETPEPPMPPIRSRHDVPSYGKYTAIILILIIAGALGYSISTVFAQAIVTVTPKTASTAINISVTTQKEPVSDGSLGYDLISINKTESQTITATTTAVVSQKASGKIVIYNSYSDAPQTLIATTRFQTADGLIYRIPKAVVIPGETVSNGKAVPGSIEVIVDADQPGSQYNIAPTDFTIPGFQSNPAYYSAFYARSDGSMTGGASGEVPVISASQRAAAVNQLNQTLQTELLSAAQNQTPSAFVFFPAAANIVYQALPDGQTSSSSLSVTINEEGTLEAAIFNVSDLSGYVASNVLNDYTSSTSINITNLSSLQFQPEGTVITDLSASSTDPITFNLNGNATFVWQFDQDQLKKDLAGQSKKNAPNILSQSYPGIEQADIVIRPFWLSTIPSDPSKIKVAIQN